MMRRLVALIIFFTPALAIAQEDTVATGPKKFVVKGYLKDMASFNFLGDSMMFQNLVHNRLNFAWYAHDNFTAYAEVRTRLMHGSFVRKIPGFGRFADSNNDYFDLSTNVVDERSVVLNTMVDRLYVQWARGDWEIKLGRQRINWGVNLAWNPNDWFNAYSFFDFDYEERPGSDALRITRYTGVASSVEVAAKVADDIDEFVGAAMWRINQWNYDVQFLAGMAQGDLALGTGWAGNIGNAGFKGELSWFHNVVRTDVNFGYDNLFMGALSADYSFPNTLYLNASVMYNSGGGETPSLLGFSTIGVRPGTVRDISPYVWSAFVQSSYQVTPLLFAGFAVIHYPGTRDFFLNPLLTVSVKQNLDLDLVGQFFYGDDFLGEFGSLARIAHVRVKWSF